MVKLSLVSVSLLAAYPFFDMDSIQIKNIQILKTDVLIFQ
jgi:hypothetical protein